jgi:protein phosphatase
MLHYNVAVISDKGRQREMNEDRAFAQVYNTSDGQTVGLFIVADGIGGQLAGEVASHWAVETIRRELADYFTPRDPQATERLSHWEIEAASIETSPTHHLMESLVDQRVQRAVQRANAVVNEYAFRKPETASTAGTTVTLALAVGDKATVANVGDSRTYLLRNHELVQISHDHSVVANLVASGRIRPEDIYTHPHRNLILRSLGQRAAVDVDLFRQELQSGDYLLLCSDGLWEMIPDEKLMASLVESSPEPYLACKKLVAAANAAGGEDNISVILVKVT